MLILVESTGVARTFIGEEAGTPEGRVLITRLGEDTIGSPWWPW